jgi:hypothetical protein
MWNWLRNKNGAQRRPSWMKRLCCQHSQRSVMQPPFLLRCYGNWGPSEMRLFLPTIIISTGERNVGTAKVQEGFLFKHCKFGGWPVTQEYHLFTKKKNELKIVHSHFTCVPMQKKPCLFSPGGPYIFIKTMLIQKSCIYRPYLLNDYNRSIIHRATATYYWTI